MSNNSFHRSSDYFTATIRHSCCNRTDESCCTLFIRHTVQTVQKGLILNIIRSIFSHISRRIDSRFFIQIINLQAGIICQNDCMCILRHLMCDLCNLCCFDHRIFFKCHSILYHVCFDSCFFLRKNLHSQIT